MRSRDKSSRNAISLCVMRGPLRAGPDRSHRPLQRLQRRMPARASCAHSRGTRRSPSARGRRCAAQHPRRRGPGSVLDQRLASRAQPSAGRGRGYRQRATPCLRTRSAPAPAGPGRPALRVRNDTDKIALNDQPHESRQATDRALVDAEQVGTDARGPDASARAACPGVAHCGKTSPAIMRSGRSIRATDCRTWR